MAYPATRDLHIIVPHYHTRLVKLMNENHLAKVGPAFVHNAGLDIEFLVFKEILRQLSQPNRSISLNVNRPAGHPCVVEQRAVLEIVIRMVMSDENVAQAVE